MAAPNVELLEFVMSFLSASKKLKQPLTEKWREVEDNFFVEPYRASSHSRTSAGLNSPYSTRNRGFGIRDNVVLKDPETHKVVMTYVSKLMKALFGEQRKEFMQARPVGWEDASVKAPEVTRLLKYVMGLPGHYQTFAEALLDMTLHGTAVIESPWKYVERSIPVREVSEQYGVETYAESVQSVPVYDDVCLRPISVDDTFPDPGNYRLADMSGFAKRFRISKASARRMAQQGIYSSSEVEEAIRSLGAVRQDDSGRVRDGDAKYAEPVSDFGEMTGYEYWGDIPESIPLRTPDGRTSNDGWGVATAINGIVVRGDAWPLGDYSLPFHSLIINPVQGRFYGTSPAEVIRYDQSFADAIKMLVAEAIVRSIHPPIAYDSDADFDPAKLRAWKADLPIPIRGGPSAIGTLQYNANYQAAFAVQSQLTDSMQGSSGARGAIQGENGPDRESASVGVARFEAAMGSVELAAMILENECLPSIARGILKRCQQFLTSEDLKRRIGDQPESLWIGDIMGDFDVQFFGSRQMQSRQEKLQTWDRMISWSAAVPAARAFLPNLLLMQKLIGDEMEMPAVAAAMGDPQQIQANLALEQAMTQNGQGGPANNGVPPNGQPAGMLPMQAAGGPSSV
jgi:hypothetical protein